MLQDRLTAIELQLHESQATDSPESQPISTVAKMAELPVFRGTVLNAGNEREGKSPHPIHSNAIANPDDITYPDHSEDDISPSHLYDDCSFDGNLVDGDWEELQAYAAASEENMTWDI